MSPWDVLGWMFVAFIGLCLLLILVSAVTETRERIKTTRTLNEMKKQFPDAKRWQE